MITEQNLVSVSNMRGVNYELGKGQFWLFSEKSISIVCKAGDQSLRKRTKNGLETMHRFNKVSILTATIRNENNELVCILSPFL
jgi:hypothetical protein